MISSAGLPCYWLTVKWILDVTGVTADFVQCAVHVTVVAPPPQWPLWRHPSQSASSASSICCFVMAPPPPPLPLSEVWGRVHPRRSSWWLWARLTQYHQALEWGRSGIPTGSSPEAWVPCPACHPPWNMKLSLNMLHDLTFAPSQKMCLYQNNWKKKSLHQIYLSSGSGSLSKWALLT